MPKKVAAVEQTKRTREKHVPVPYIRPRVLTIEEAVAYARRSRASLYIDIRAGVLDARKFGRKTVVCVDSLDRMLDALPSA